MTSFMIPESTNVFFEYDDIKFNTEDILQALLVNMSLSKKSSFRANSLIFVTIEKKTLNIKLKCDVVKTLSQRDKKDKSGEYNFNLYPANTKKDNPGNAQFKSSLGQFKLKTKKKNQEVSFISINEKQNGIKIVKIDSYQETDQLEALTKEAAHTTSFFKCQKSEYTNDQGDTEVLLTMPIQGTKNLDTSLAEPLSDITKLDLMAQAIRETNKVHRHKKVHSDIKASNFMVDDNFKSLRVIDFGLTEDIRDDHWNYLNGGSYYYFSPERLNNNVMVPAKYKSDNYPLTMTLLEVLIGIDVGTVMHTVYKKLNQDTYLRAGIKGFININMDTHINRFEIDVNMLDRFNNNIESPDDIMLIMNYYVYTNQFPYSRLIETIETEFSSKMNKNFIPLFLKPFKRIGF